MTLQHWAQIILVGSAGVIALILGFEWGSRR